MLFYRKDKASYQLHHDWQNYDDFKEAYEFWFEFKAKVKPVVTVSTEKGYCAQTKTNLGILIWKSAYF